MHTTVTPRVARRLAAAALLTLAPLLGACDDDDDEVGPTQTIVETAAGSANLSTLASAVQAAGLTGTLSGDGPFTVFAPQNTAFSAVPSEQSARLLDPANRALLTKVLTYHVVPGRLLANQLTDGQTLTSVQGATLAVRVQGGVTTVNGVRVVTPDVLASNGVVHVIDGVLTQNLDIVDVATLNGFTSLLSAVQTAGLTNALRGNGNGQGLTVFAPTNAAFAAIPGGAPADAAALGRVLQQHVVAGRAPANTLANGQALNTLLGRPLTVSIASGAVSLRATNSARVVTTDVPASNGIIHVIDTVLLP